MAKRDYRDNMFLTQVERYKQSFKNCSFDYDNVPDLKECVAAFFDNNFNELDNNNLRLLLRNTLTALCKNENLPKAKLSFSVNDRNSGSALFDLVSISKIIEPINNLGEHYLITLLHEFRHYKWHYFSKQYFNNEAQHFTDYEKFMAIYNVVNDSLLESNLHTDAILGFQTPPVMFHYFNECELDAYHYSNEAYKQICEKLNKQPKEELIRHNLIIAKAPTETPFEKENITSKEELVDFTCNVIKKELDFFKKHFKNNEGLKNAITDLKKFDFNEYKTVVNRRLKSLTIVETKSL